MTTLLVRGGRVVDEHAVRTADVLVVDDRVAEIRDAGLAGGADVVLDARGLHVLPGVIDAHVHFNEPGRTEWEGFSSGTAAAAAGGITTVCEMPLNSHPPTLDARALSLKRGAVAEHAYVDYAFWGGIVPQSLPRLAELRAEGVIGVKGFLCDSGLPEFPPLDEFSLLDTMQRCAELDLLLALHAEAGEETRRLGEQARAAGRRGPLDWARSRPPESELSAVQNALTIARETGARVHFVHISTAAAARSIRAARSAGIDASLETCPHYLALDETDLERLGPLAKCAPPLRPPEFVEELWDVLLDDVVDLVASDHSPCPPAMKDTDDIWSAWGGISGVQTMLSVLLSEGVHRRGLPLQRLVSLLSANPARRLRLFPRKGALAAGSDADLVLVDLDRTWIPSPAELRTRWPTSPFSGRALRGQVVSTIVRGSVVYSDASLRVEPGFGRPVFV